MQAKPLKPLKFTDIVRRIIQKDLIRLLNNLVSFFVYLAFLPLAVYGCKKGVVVFHRGKVQTKLERLCMTFVFPANGKNSTSAVCRLVLVR